VDAAGRYNVFVLALRHNSSGTSCAAGPAAGRSIPIEQCLVARPTDDENAIHHALSRGKNLILTPGVYAVDKPIEVKRQDTIVLASACQRSWRGPALRR
jgi:hypothetical protein